MPLSSEFHNFCRKLSCTIALPLMVIWFLSLFSRFSLFLIFSSNIMIDLTMILFILSGINTTFLIVAQWLSSILEKVQPESSQILILPIICLSSPSWTFVTNARLIMSCVTFRLFLISHTFLLYCFSLDIFYWPAFLVSNLLYCSSIAALKSIDWVLNFSYWFFNFLSSRFSSIAMTWPQNLPSFSLLPLNLHQTIFLVILVTSACSFKKCDIG